ncbi:MAG: hypothetical protein PF692_09350 [Kiritimatiellae bacterium]|jgi:hypothetical protein|nr:hypothetical protein [Kiritimatiellia bacterium]
MSSSLPTTAFTLQPQEYRFGFQGQACPELSRREKDNEWTGTEGSHLAFKYRVHDARIGRFLSVDPLTAKYPYNSPYAFSENSTIAYGELEGLEKVVRIYGSDGRLKLTVTDEAEIEEYRTKALLLSVPGWKWANRDDRFLVADISNEKFEGPRSGSLSIREQEDGGATIYFDDYERDRKQALIEIDFQDRKGWIIADGVSDVLIGAIGMVTSGAATIFSSPFGGSVPSLIAFGVSADLAAGGLTKITDPRSTFEGRESSPLKYCVVRTFGENGEMAFDAIALSSGAYSMIDASKLIDIVGVYGTMKAAKEYRDDYIKNDTQDNASEEDE